MPMWPAILLSSKILTYSFFLTFVVMTAASHSHCVMSGPQGIVPSAMFNFVKMSLRINTRYEPCVGTLPCCGVSSVRPRSLVRERDGGCLSPARSSSSTRCICDAIRSRREACRSSANDHVILASSANSYCIRK